MILIFQRKELQAVTKQFTKKNPQRLYKPRPQPKKTSWGTFTQPSLRAKAAAGTPTTFCGPHPLPPTFFRHVQTQSLGGKKNTGGSHLPSFWDTPPKPPGAPTHSPPPPPQRSTPPSPSPRGTAAVRVAPRPPPAAGKPPAAPAGPPRHPRSPAPTPPRARLPRRPSGGFCCGCPPALGVLLMGPEDEGGPPVHDHVLALLNAAVAPPGKRRPPGGVRVPPRRRR